MANTPAGGLEEAWRRFLLRDRVRFIRRALANAGEADGLILDVGCGGGLLLRILGEHGLRVLGLDFCLDSGVLAWRRYGVPAVCATLSHAPIPKNSCSVVAMCDVLDHLYDPAAYLESAHELLTPRGRLVVQVPNAASWQFMLLGEHWSGLDAPRQLLMFRPRDLEVLLDRCGFEVVRRNFFSLRDNPAAFATSLAPNLDPAVRRVRHIAETPAIKLLKDALYLGLAVAGLPLAALEAACHAGSIILVEARKKT